MSIRIRLNGKEKSINQGTDIQSLLNALGVSRQNLIIALNRKVIEKEYFKAQILKDNDELELIQMMGGG